MSTTMRRRGRASAGVLGAAGLCLAGVTMLPWSPAAAEPGPATGYDYHGAVQPLSGCEANALPGNDDQVFEDPVDIGFPVNFFGDVYSTLFVNNNGNVTFQAASGDYTPDPLLETDFPVIAPFYTDIDTRGPGRTVHYGSGTSATGQKYFCVDYIEVAQYSQNASQGLDSFQLVLWDASGAGQPGDFDIEFNYDAMPWDHGTARAGFASGTGIEGTSYELPGGPPANSMTDGDTNALVASSANSSQLGRYRYPVRGDGVIPTGEISGLVTSSEGDPVSGARVEACRSNGFCRTTTSAADGSYAIGNLRGGDYALTVFPPDDSGNPGHGTATLDSDSDTASADLTLTLPQPPPNGTQIPSQNGTAVVGGVEVPVIYWGTPHPFTFTGCVGATSAQVRFEGYNNDGTPYVDTVTAVESPSTPGTYSATIPRFDVLGVHGDMVVHEIVDCGTGPDDQSFNIYIDPSGTIVDENGDPVAGATVTLLSSDSADGTFTPVPDGSSVMSPSNRTNPDVTDADGQYAWDVVAGYYVVRAEKAGCSGPGGADYVESDVLTIPPAVTGLDLELDCSSTPVNDPPVVDAGPAASGTVGSAIALSGTASDPDADPLTVAWSVSSTDCTVTDPSSASTTVVCTAPGTYTATLSADDGSHPAQTDTTTVTVSEDSSGDTCVGLTTSPGVTSTTDPSTGVTTFTGTSGNDVIIGTPGVDVIRAGNGNDVVCASTGDDSVFGGRGDDLLRGQSGKDVVRGQDGTDRVLGNDGNDKLLGNNGDDRLIGGKGNDRMLGGQGTDACDGGQGTDTASTCESVVGVP